MIKLGERVEIVYDRLKEEYGVWVAIEYRKIADELMESVEKRSDIMVMAIHKAVRQFPKYVDERKRIEEKEEL